ncbi:histone acetyltransferase KAT6B-like isoform X1 [Pygocentrus nattereri]|uniref:histone acetyltransferase KAT6B-like isoform X1 n=1 Tax=Pygocentrus nattereri TaxID=42514 RepID=UPI00081450BF|nr:histone acetyltransferase KAT6B-like isoform X1 [Pygocentrus nattereri]
MRPLSVLLCAVTITCFCYCASSEDFTVTQTPSELTVKEGGSVSVACCWDKNITGVKVKWFKDDQLTGHWSDERLHSEIQGNCSVLSIKNIRNNETGLYICEVTRDVPKLDIRRGEGTAVKIQAENGVGRFPEEERPIKTRSKDVNFHKPPSTEENKVPFTSHDGVVYAVRCLPFVTLLLAVCYLNSDTKRRPQPKPRSQNAEEEERELVEGEEQTGEEREQDGGNEQVQGETGLEERNEQTRTEPELEEEDIERGGKVELEERQERTRQEREVKDEEKNKRSEEVLVEKKGAEVEEQDVKMDEPAQSKENDSNE